jgi:hypothetical protein
VIFGSVYGTEALRRMRELQEQAVQEPERQPSLLEQIPPDAPMADATVTVWHGDRFVAYGKRLATTPLADVEKQPEDKTAIPVDADCVAGDCGGARIWLVKEGERWLMYVGSRRSARRRDFATPYLGHAIRTAGQWYGAPGGGWRAEKGRDAKKPGTREAADLPPQDSTTEEGTGKRGHDDLDLDGESVR